jgi:hypothetical protein
MDMKLVSDFIRDKTTKDWGKLYNKTASHFTLNGIRVTESERMRWAGHVAPMEWMTSVYKILIKNLKGWDHSPAGSKHRWYDNITMDF